LASSGKLRDSPITILATAPIRTRPITSTMRAKTRRIRSPNGRVALGHEAGDHVQIGGDRLAHHRPEQVLLGLEIEIERALGDPGRAAMSSSRAAAKPFSANTSSAAWTISPGRASLRLRHFGCPGCIFIAHIYN
jgi:hypothetical protein